VEYKSVFVRDREPSFMSKENSGGHMIPETPAFRFLAQLVSTPQKQIHGQKCTLLFLTALQIIFIFQFNEAFNKMHYPQL
jgi:hypothetical protein